MNVHPASDHEIQFGWRRFRVKQQGINVWLMFCIIFMKIDLKEQEYSETECLSSQLNAQTALAGASMCLEVVLNPNSSRAELPDVGSQSTQTLKPQE